MLAMVTIVTATVVIQIVSQNLCVLRISIVKIMKLEVPIMGALNDKTFRK